MRRSAPDSERKTEATAGSGITGGSGSGNDGNCAAVPGTGGNARVAPVNAGGGKTNSSAVGRPGDTRNDSVPRRQGNLLIAATQAQRWNQLGARSPPAGFDCKCANLVARPSPGGWDVGERGRSK